MSILNRELFNGDTMGWGFFFEGMKMDTVG